MEQVWLALAEIAMEPGDLPSGSTLGFMNVTMWASSEPDFSRKLEAYLSKNHWKLLSIENIRVADPSTDYSDEVNQLIDETLSNKNRIGLGTFYSYKPN